MWGRGAGCAFASGSCRQYINSRIARLVKARGGGGVDWCNVGIDERVVRTGLRIGGCEIVGCGLQVKEGILCQYSLLSASLLATSLLVCRPLVTPPLPLLTGHATTTSSH